MFYLQEQLNVFHLKMLGNSELHLGKQEYINPKYIFENPHSPNSQQLVKKSPMQWVRETNRTEVGVLRHVFCDALVLCRQRHDQQQRVPCLLAHSALPMDEGNKQGEDEEVGGSLIFTGVKKQLQDGGVLSQHAAQLV